MACYFHGDGMARPAYAILLSWPILLAFDRLIIVNAHIDELLPRVKCDINDDSLLPRQRSFSFTAGA